MARIVDATPEAIDEAARRLRGGGIVGFPTETVYGLGGDTFREDALEAIYAAKGRRADNPLITHVLDADGAQLVVAAWDTRAAQLAQRFWPGPLTLIVPKAHDVPGRATGGLATIAVRAPRHPVARGLLVAFDGPISAPSANRSGHVSPTSARHVADDFAGATDLLVLDGGECEIGLESTVLDLTGPRPVVLRPGSVTEPALREVVGDVEVPTLRTQAGSPGTAARHYAPRTPTLLVEPAALADCLRMPAPASAVLCFEADAVVSPHRAIEMPQGAGAYAHHLYDALRRADAMRLERIVVEMPPTSNELWKAIRDRLERATNA